MFENYWSYKLLKIFYWFAILAVICAAIFIGLVKGPIFGALMLLWYIPVRLLFEMSSIIFDIYEKVKKLENRL